MPGSRVALVKLCLTGGSKIGGTVASPIRRPSAVMIIYRPEYTKLFTEVIRITFPHPLIQAFIHRNAQATFPQVNGSTGRVSDMLRGQAE